MQPTPKAGSRQLESRHAAQLGAAATMVLLMLTACEWLGIAHTEFTAFVVDEMQNGEARFNPNGDIHGDWGNRVFAALSLPAFVGTGISLLIEAWRSYTKGTAE